MISLLNFVIQCSVEVDALLQVFRGVALGDAGFLLIDLDAGAGRQGNGGRDGGCCDNGEEIEVHVGCLECLF